MDPNTITRNVKGTVLNGDIPTNNNQKYKDSDNYFFHYDIQYEGYTPKTFTLHLGEFLLWFEVVEDRTILGYSNEDKVKVLRSSRDRNEVILANKIYPAKEVPL